MASFPDRLKQLREEHTLYQKELASILGLSRSTITAYEAGKREPDQATLSKIAGYFNVTTDYLLGRTDDPTDHNTEVAIKTIQSAITDAPELLEFWQELTQRKDLQLLFKQVKPMTPEGVKKVMRILKAIEDEPQEKED